MCGSGRVFYRLSWGVEIHFDENIWISIPGSIFWYQVSSTTFKDSNHMMHRCKIPSPPCVQLSSSCTSEEGWEISQPENLGSASWSCMLPVFLPASTAVGDFSTLSQTRSRFAFVSHQSSVGLMTQNPSSSNPHWDEKRRCLHKSAFKGERAQIRRSKSNSLQMRQLNGLNRRLPTGSVNAFTLLASCLHHL